MERIQSVRIKKSVPCPTHAEGLGNAASHTADEEAHGSNYFHGRDFIHTLDSSIFPQKNGHGNKEYNENDDESSVIDPESFPIEDFELDESASPEEFFPLASQCSQSVAILSPKI